MLLFWIVYQLKNLFLIIFIAYIAFNYRRAAKFEVGMAPESKSSQNFNNMIEHLTNSVNKIYKGKVLAHQGNNCKALMFQHTKIVAWLLNRPSVESEKN